MFNVLTYKYRNKNISHNHLTYKRFTLHYLESQRLQLSPAVGTLRRFCSGSVIFPLDMTMLLNGFRTVAADIVAEADVDKAETVGDGLEGF